MKALKMTLNKVLIGIAALLAAGLYWEFCYSLDGFAGVFFGDFSSEDTTEYASGYSDKGFRKLRKGMTEKEVRALLGEPIRVWEYRPPKELREKRLPAIGWTYSRTPNDDSYRIRVVHFQEGEVSRIFSEFYVD